MKKLNLDETWDKCIEMWEWIASEVKKIDGFDDLDREGKDDTVEDLKSRWVFGHDCDILIHDCFFCAFAIGNCSRCPAVQIDSSFKCNTRNDPVHPNFAYDPIGFFELVKKLNRKRLKGKS